MNDLAVSLIRTWVPVGVGAVLSWLITLGANISPADQAGAVAALTALCIAVYYAAVRAAERKWPAAGVLLGHTAQPSYAKAAAPPGGTAADERKAPPAP